MEEVIWRSNMLSSNLFLFLFVCLYWKSNHVPGSREWHIQSQNYAGNRSSCIVTASEQSSHIKLKDWNLKNGFRTEKQECIK